MHGWDVSEGCREHDLPRPLLSPARAFFWSRRWREKLGFDFWSGDRLARRLSVADQRNKEGRSDEVMMASGFIYHRQSLATAHRTLPTSSTIGLLRSSCFEGAGHIRPLPISAGRDTGRILKGAKPALPVAGVLC